MSKGRRVLVFVVVALLLFYLISNPKDAASSVQAGLGHLQAAANSLVTFATNLF